VVPTTVSYIFKPTTSDTAAPRKKKISLSGHAVLRCPAQTSSLAGICQIQRSSFLLLSLPCRFALPTMLSPSEFGRGYDMSLVACAWSLWAVALVAVICRFISRRLLAGPKFWKDLKADDCLMVVALVSLAGVAWSTNEIAANGSNYVEEGATEGWSEDQVTNAVWGSKMLVALEEFMISTLWLVKFCLLILYGRMT
jgi:hypothetical protein